MAKLDNLADDIEIMSREDLKADGFTEEEIDSLFKDAENPIGPDTLFISMVDNTIIAHMNRICVAYTNNTNKGVIPGTGPIFYCSECHKPN